MEFLPEEAKDIHVECKGSPMVISMIGGLISESGRHSQRQRQSGRWGYYLQSLQSRGFSKSESVKPDDNQSFSECRSNERRSERALMTDERERDHFPSL